MGKERDREDVDLQSEPEGREHIARDDAQLPMSRIGDGAQQWQAMVLGKVYLVQGIRRGDLTGMHAPKRQMSCIRCKSETVSLKEKSHCGEKRCAGK